MSDKKEPYVPPPVAWRLPVFLEATPEELTARLVDCSTCPVYLLCEAGEGGTGWVCGTCKATGVAVEQIEESKLPDDLLIIDCATHKFNRIPAAENMTVCSLCGGGQVELEINFPNSRAHLITTVHAHVPVTERQRFLREQMAYWKDMYAKKPGP
jgi:hypothetical protein